MTLHFQTPQSISYGTDVCVTDACVTDACVTDACVTDARVTDPCVTDPCVTDACLRMHVLRMHVLRMHLLRMHVLRMHVLQMHVLPPRFVQYSCKFSNLKLFSLKSQRYIVLTSLYSWMKISRLAAFNKRFSKLTYVLKSSWSNRSSIALMIQSKILKYILRK